MRRRRNGGGLDGEDCGGGGLDGEEEAEGREQKERVGLGRSAASRIGEESVCGDWRLAARVSPWGDSLLYPMRVRNRRPGSNQMSIGRLRMLKL